MEKSTLSRPRTTAGHPQPRFRLGGEESELRAPEIVRPDPSAFRSTTWSQRLGRRLLGMRLSHLGAEGRLNFHDADGSRSYGDESAELTAEVYVYDGAFYRMTALDGSLGVAESYLRGHWDSDDLTMVFRIILRCDETNQGLERGSARLRDAWHKLRHVGRRNTLKGSRKNIEAHYDLSNDFFSLFLDPTLSYSSAYFEEPGLTLEEASRAKLDLVARQLELEPDDHLLEIGSGWGGLAIHMAANYGCRVTTTTISKAQYDLAAERIRRAGLEDRIDLVLQDYRELKGEFDKVVSIEMIEAVGHHYFDAYFATINRLLVPGGRALIQAITIDDAHYLRTRDDVDFIKKYIFPGCCIPSIGAIRESVDKTEMQFDGLKDIGLHYGETLRVWRRNFLAARDEVEKLGFDERFQRLWEYYLRYCEAGFDEQYIRVHQISMTRDALRRSPTL